ncbi:MAG TPA: YggT family protein [Bacillota bacterium]|nr:YggT family protein [Bacillota bacterium]HPZ89842.1 YggT family protein [Bacillota bacterium]HQE01142.1 YggT family protein [Bacillota bacterium]
MPDNIRIVINSLLNVFYLLLLARTILSWFPLRPGGVMADIFDVLHAMTEPLLAPIRKLLPPIPVGMGYLDLSPWLLMFLLGIVRRMLL